jgi:hypothetical protein
VFDANLNKCTFLVSQSQAGLYERPTVILGAAFLKSKYVIFDMDNKQVGFYNFTADNNATVPILPDWAIAVIVIVPILGILLFCFTTLFIICVLLKHKKKRTHIQTETQIGKKIDYDF